MGDFFDPNNEELLKEFFSEAEIQVEALESNILVLENNPDNRDAVDELFRAAHTLKGSSATMEMTELAEFTHLMEDTLDQIRSQAISATDEVIDTLLAAVDLIKSMLNERRAGKSYQGDAAPVADRLRGLLRTAGKAPPSTGTIGTGQPRAAAEATTPRDAGTAASERAGTSSRESRPTDAGRSASASTGTGRAEGDSAAIAGRHELGQRELAELREAAEADSSLYRVLVDFNSENPMNTVGGIQVFAALKRVGQVLKTEPEFEALYEDNFFPTVEYYIGTKEDASRIGEVASIPDVTTDVRIEVLDEQGGPAARPAEQTQRFATAQSQAAAEESARAAGSPMQAQARAADAEGAETAPAAGRQRAEGEHAAKAEVQTEQDTERHPETGHQTDTRDQVDKPARGSGAAEPRGRSADAASQGEGRQAVAGSILRVDSKRIDELLNLVSETVINKAAFNQITQSFASVLDQFDSAESRYRELLRELFDTLPQLAAQLQNGQNTKGLKRELNERFGELFTLFDQPEKSLKETVNRFRGNAQNLGRITSELQEGVMRIRMVPISQIFSRFPRLVRDLSRSLNKKIELDIEGEETELDKSVIEDLLDPLIHCVRNSIDHGVETPEERREAGKPEAGTVSLCASNEGNMIVIEVSDDGRGIDVNAIRDKAIQRGVIHPNKALSDLEAFNLIFDPGFSTAREVTNVSGRGVGLDVVKRQIDRLNGSVSVWSQKGLGTRFTIKLPLTLAIIQGLLVRVGSEMYAIPITSVIESHRIRPADIKLIDNYEVFNVREDVISLLRLNRLFHVPTDEQREYYYVVIVGSGDRKVGLIVDSLIGEEDVVIKPLRDHYTNAPGIAGANITGDGRVSLIIDVSQLLDLGLAHEREERQRREAPITGTRG